jgi:hypothetical protein
MEFNVKDFLEPFFYPHNIFLWGLLLATLYYRKKGLLILLLWFYVFGNGWTANQVRHWYSAQIATDMRPERIDAELVMLGCGGDRQHIPECAKQRLQQLAQLMTVQNPALPVYVTTRYCQPYLDYLASSLQQQLPDYSRVDVVARLGQVQCFNGGDTTYHEMYQLTTRVMPNQPVWFISSDYHAYRVRQLAEQYQFKATVFAARSSTFKPVNCGINCYLTVNLSNFDLFAKLSTEFLSFGIYDWTKRWTDWYKTPPAPAIES